MATAIIEHQDQLAPVNFSFVRDGVAGNYDVIAKMIELVRNSLVLDKGLENFLKQTLSDAGLNSHSNTEAIFTFIYNYVHNNVEYIQDIAGNTESIKSARTTLQDGYGDCDDQSILIATWLASLGYEPNFVIARYNDDLTANFQHVYVSVYANGERFVFDTTLEFGQLNDEVKTTSKDEIPVFKYNPDIDGLFGSVRGIKNLINDTARNGIQAATTFAGLLPLGFLPSQFINLSKPLFGSLTEKDKSINAKGSEILGQLTDTIIELQNGRMSVEVAKNRGYKLAADFYIEGFQKRGDYPVYNSILKRIEQRLHYIDSFGQTANTQGLDIHLNPNYMLLMGVGLIGFGAYLFFSKR